MPHSLSFRSPTLSSGISSSISSRLLLCLSSSVLSSFRLSLTAGGLLALAACIGVAVSPVAHADDSALSDVAQLPESLGYHGSYDRHVKTDVDDDVTPDTDLCSVIFPSSAVALKYCPANHPPVIAYDFWKNQPLGWSCDCSHN